MANAEPTLLNGGADAAREDPVQGAPRTLSALVVDDSAALRKTLRLVLARWGFDVLEASDGASALEICRSRPVDFLISDWMMPGVTGPDLCRAVRALGREEYAYIILLTAKSQAGEIVAGLDAGADDFLVKPPDFVELRARLRAGERLIRMHDDLVDKNRRVSEAFDRLNVLYQEVDGDLRAAARLQQALIPDRQTRCGPVPIGIAWQPAGHVGGDLVGFYQGTESRIVAYSIDVSGHGVSSALMTARISNLFAARHLDENIGIRRLPSGEYHPRDPAAIVAELNERLQDEADCDQYFTMMLADTNFDTGLIRFCQAGHPNAVIIRRDGRIEFVGRGGAPVGLIPGMQYETDVVSLEPGDRFMMLSDGITEAANDRDEMLEEDGLARILAGRLWLGEKEMLDHVLTSALAFAGRDRFEDDVSAIVLTMP